MSKARDIADLGAVTSRLDTVGASDGALSNRNLIINGGFDVWQRGTSFTGSGYTSDRWIISTGEPATAITKTASRDKRNTLKITFGSVISCNLDQRIEAFGNVGSNQPVTLSFYVRGSKATTGDFCRIRNHTTSTTLETLYYDITTSWTKVTKTFSANSTWAKDDVARLYLFSAQSSAWSSSDYVEFSDVQLEVGDTATPFEHRSYGDELQRCQRYYYEAELTTAWFNDGYLSTNGFSVQSIPFPVSMRAKPTATGDMSTNWVTSNVVTQFINSYNNSSGSWQIRASATGRAYSYYNANDGATLKFDAEL